jgi:FAD/FMN-containing dehydrogenase
MQVVPRQEPTFTRDYSLLAARLPGKVYLPSDSQYEEARQAWNLTVDQRPEVIVYVESLEDVVEAVSFARQNGLGIAVQSTGHGVIRAADGAMLINTSRMKERQIDVQAQTAWIGAGMKWGEVLEETQKYGLAPLLGSSPDVGAVGYTLGGGMGWLARKYGTSADSVLRLEVVTANGEIRQASPEENSDLFWALRGGGGGFGVVTGMEIRLYPVTEVYAGNLYYPPEMAREVFERFRQWANEAPDELTASIVLMNVPPLPDIPPMLSGKSFVIVRGCYSGELEEGEKLMQSWRAWQEPLIDDFKVLPFTQSAQISQDPVEPGPFPTTGAWLSDLSAEAAEVLVRYTLPQGGPPPLVFSEVRMAGGAISRIDGSTNAYSQRDGQWIWVSIGIAMSPEVGEQIEQHFEQMHLALSAYLTGKVYMNFIHGEEGMRRSKDGFSEGNYRRLQEIKARYDPENRFGYSFQIQPAGE